MIRRIKVKDYEYKHPLGTVVVDLVEVGVSENGRRSLSASEIERLSGLAALNFLKVNYKKAINDADFTLSASKIRAIISFLRVNQIEFGRLVGCQKAKVSKMLHSEQQISKSQAMLALERLVMELARPGSTRKLLGDERVVVKEADGWMVRELNEIRYAAVG